MGVNSLNPTLVVSMSSLSLFNIVQMQVFICSILSPTHHSKNGVAERKNRSLKEIETCMMEAKNLPPKYWAEDINYASYIQNRVPHKHLQCMTPFESWSGHNPDVTHFRIFGSKAWARISTEKRKALHPQSQECIFVG